MSSINPYHGPTLLDGLQLWTFFVAFREPYADATPEVHCLRMSGEYLWQLFRCTPCHTVGLALAML